MAANIVSEEQPPLLNKKQVCLLFISRLAIHLHLVWMVLYLNLSLRNNKKSHFI